MMKLKLSTLALSLSLLGLGAMESDAKPREDRFAANRAQAGALVAHPQGANAKMHGKHKARKAKRKAMRLQKFDTNNDGVLDDAEKLSMKRQRFAKLDLNSNGSLTAAEAQQAKEQLRAQRRAAKGKAAVPAKAKGKMRMAKGKMRFAERFARIDANGDGVVTWSEFAQKRKGKGRRGNKGMRPQKG